jgi:hypothetical protein
MDVIPAPIQSALDLFESTLSDVRFADIDAKTLARAASGVKEVAGAVVSAQAALDSARSVLEERQNVLLELVARAIAYARVYAENDEELRRKLDAIRLPRPVARAPRGHDASSPVLSEVPPPAARGRGRPRKTPVSGPVEVVAPVVAASSPKDAAADLPPVAADDTAVVLPAVGAGRRARHVEEDRP